MPGECVMHPVSAFGGYALVQVKEGGKKIILSVSPAVNLCLVRHLYIKARGQGCNKPQTGVFPHLKS